MSQDTLQRQWYLLDELRGQRLGVTIETLLERLQTSKATLYRDLRLLQESNWVEKAETLGGKARYRLLGEGMPAVQLTVHQVHALRLARRLLTPLEGTAILRELDTLLRLKGTRARRAPAIEVATPQSMGEPSSTNAIERAMLASARIAFTYAATRGEPSQRTVDPLALHVRDGQLYLNAFDVDRGALRTFKIARISAARVLEEKAQTHPEYDEAHVFAHAAKIWDGPVVAVVVRISRRGARYVKEWPLVPSQELEEQPDGAVIVRAQVSGTIEAMRWVLRWGKDAQVLEPAELRAAVVKELLGAIAAYTGEGVSGR